MTLGNCQPKCTDTRRNIKQAAPASKAAATGDTPQRRPTINTAAPTNA